jgi:predicted small metal-binding protein
MITTEWLRDTQEIVSTMQVCTGHKPVEREHTGNSGPKAFCVCKALGMDCSFEATGTTDNEIMRKFIDHAGSAHTMDLLTADVIYRIQQAIKK